MMDLVKQINEKKQKLNETRAKLKAHFVGLDEQIDDILDTIEAWYIMPEFITRPVIVNIWGMTGTGKTDLIRRLAHELGMLNKFFELQMDTKKNTWVRSIEGSFDLAGIEESEPAIVLFDEMQRFRTKDRHGDQIDNDVYQDIWMLLSDGTFSNNAGTMCQIQELLYEQMYDKEREEWDKRQKEKDKETAETDESGKKTTPKESPDFKFKNSYWRSKQLKKSLKLDQPVEEIMTWSTDKKIKMIYERAHDDLVNKGADYNKLLIFICGNLDDAYTMASNVEESDIDADIFHEFSKKINVIDIKEALNKRFQPEQIARLGNNHIIYPALSKANFKELISRNIANSTSMFNDMSSVNLTVHDSVLDMVYRNGVFPTQGVRPVFTTISSTFESNIPEFLLFALENHSPDLSMSFDQEDDHLIGTLSNGLTLRKHIKCDIDRTKKKLTEDKICKTAVHEAGHAVVYTALFKIAPTQVVANSSSTWKSGFMMTHGYNSDKHNMYNRIAACYGGQCAERMVFGDMLTTAGCTADVANATTIAADMVRYAEQDQLIGRISDAQSVAGEKLYITNVDDTNKAVASILEINKKKATDILHEYQAFHTELTTRLIEKAKVEQEEIVEIAKKYGIDARCEDSSYDTMPGYKEKFEEYKRTRK